MDGGLRFGFGELIGREDWKLMGENGVGKKNGKGGKEHGEGETEGLRGEVYMLRKKQIEK